MSAARRRIWGIGDQGFSSLTNFALAVVLARNLDLPAFGAASLAFSIYVIALSVSRSIASEPFTVRHSGVADDAWRAASGRSLGSALVMGVLVGLGLAAAGVVAVAIEGPDALVGPVLIVTAVVMPGLLMQDAWRFVFFGAGRPRDAFVNDLVWGIALVPALGVALLAGVVAPWPYVLAWGVAGGVAGLVGIVQSRVRPAPLQFRAWLADHRDLVGRYVVESVILSTASQTRLIIITAVGGLALGGAIRLGQVVLNAIHPFTQGLGLTIVPEAVATARRSIPALDRMIGRFTLVMVAIPLAWGLIAWFLPVDVGTAIFGDSWTIARETIPGMTLVFVAAGMSSGAMVGLRATAAAAHSLRARTVAAGLALPGAAIGALTGDPGRCAWALGFAAVLGVPVWWVQYRSASRGTVAGGAHQPRMGDSHAPPMDRP